MYAAGQNFIKFFRTFFLCTMYFVHGILLGTEISLTFHFHFFKIVIYAAVKFNKII